MADILRLRVFSSSREAWKEKVLKQKHARGFIFVVTSKFVVGVVRPFSYSRRSLRKWRWKRVYSGAPATCAAATCVFDLLVSDV